MARYERVNDRDADAYDSDSDHSLLPSPTDASPASAAAAAPSPSPPQQHPHPPPHPSSPPPSFRSRASSTTIRRRQDRPVDPTLADAFESDGDASDDDDADDVRQRLVRQPASGAPADDAASSGEPASSRTLDPNATAIAGPYAWTGPRANTATGRPRVVGGGMQSDGVFSNLSARPEVGDDEKEEAPPSYEQAAADQAPPYWETTILAPGLGGPDEVYLDGMPIGSLFSFLWNATISMSFQLVGFLLTYLLHSTHAAKNGSRAGLGVTLIQYGFYLRGVPDDDAGGGGPAGGSPTNSDGYAAPANPNSHDFDPNAVVGGGGAGAGAGFTASEIMSYVMMVVGWFILIRAVSDYLRARRHELLVLGNAESRFGVVSVFAETEHPERVV